MKVVVAMSGGVDSSVAAALLKEEGYEVIGVTMQIWPSNELADEAEKFGGCCGLGAVADAKRVAHKLGIPHYVMNFRDLFAEKVIANFCREYSLGRTPNPCIRCNEYLKFDALLRRAKELGADFVATGHYARIAHDEVSGRYLLRKGVDHKKDQSYVLYVMTQDQLRHALMPLGGSVSASSKTSSIRLAGMISISCLTSSGTSIRSFTLRSGMITRLIPARCAANSFSLIPAINN